MTEVEQFATKNLTVIDVSGGGTRPVAELFETEFGIVFLDIGWNDPYPGRNPVHAIGGEIQKEGPAFRIGQALIRKANEGEPGQLDLLSWNEAKTLPDFQGATREAAARDMDEAGYFDTPGLYS